MTSTGGRAIDFDTATTLTRMFYEQVAALDDRPFLWRKAEGAWHPMSWRETAERVDALAQGLALRGIKPGDRVMIVSENRPEWLIADMAAMAIGAITVPAYTTNTVADHLHILNDSGAAAVVVSTRALAKRVYAAAAQASETPFVITIDDQALAQNPGVETVKWMQLIHDGQPLGRPKHWEGAEADDTACIIYTSGTGGAPKGVMLSHKNVLANCMGAFDVLEILGLGDEVFLSFLPLSHSYEHSAGQFFPISIGAQIYYAEGLDKLSENFQEVRPTITTAVPRLFEFMRNRILRAMEKQTGTKVKLFYKAIELGAKKYEKGLGPMEAMTNWVLGRLVRRKVAQRFGGRLKALVSGGAPLNYDIGLFFMALDVPILQGYGQTEAAPVISVQRPGSVRLESVGPPLKGVEVQIAEDGEILARGPMVMRGYWKGPEQTRKAIDAEGWLHTGDVGHFDDAGNIVITDRKKDIIVNSGGDNIAPARVEGFLTLEPEIAQAMVYGDRRPHLVALLVPDPDWLATWKNRRKRDRAAETEAEPAAAGAAAAPKAADAEQAGTEVETRPADKPEGITAPPVAAREAAGAVQAPARPQQVEAEGDPEDEFVFDDPALVEALSQAVSRVNRNMANVEKIRRFCVAPEGFTVENGMLTPTLKIRRHVIRDTYKDMLERLYEK
ncbi:Long-chain-fatty-acid--CoA ligase [Caenispirillum salinarum AK4]|uniref:Long-chain-fatty-acid--CoA ligase n=1 Tax=Caenispirillum salinarum AK4 TaxID=1238182 RepID=K9H3C2_9PROT|nr:long-chain fatty acid--CoA ligase [Caenispirillum salinarum]EKV31549.1 Long-chain-fatty-acid--CoA ligase [Caenispirillum salinarum AK4]